MKIYLDEEDLIEIVEAVRDDGGWGDSTMVFLLHDSLKVCVSYRHTGDMEYDGDTTGAWNIIDEKLYIRSIEVDGAEIVRYDYDLLEKLCQYD